MVAKKVENMGRSAVEPGVFLRIRCRIAEALRADGIEVREDASPLELTIGTFAPSSILKRFQVSDFPFIGSRYLSVRDGHVYVVAGTTDDGSQVMAYRLGFFRSAMTTRGGIAVGITEEAWLESCMVMFSLQHASFEMSAKGELLDIYDEAPTRRTYPVKKTKAFLAYLTRAIGLGSAGGAGR